MVNFHPTCRSHETDLRWAYWVLKRHVATTFAVVLLWTISSNEWPDYNKTKHHQSDSTWAKPLGGWTETDPRRREGRWPRRRSKGEPVSAWWRHQMEKKSALLAICAGNSPDTDEFPQWRGSLMFSMMTSSNGNIFRVTSPLCGEFTGHRWIPLTKASGAEFWCFLWSAPG